MRKIITISFILLISSLLTSCSYQSQSISRWTWKPVEIELPEVCKSDYQFSFSKWADVTYKYVTCKDSEGNWITKEYSDWWVLEGSIKWTQVEKK